MSSTRNPKNVDASKKSLITIKGKQPGLLSRYLIRYDTWIQHFTPKSRRRKRSEHQQANLDQSVRNHHNKLECLYLSVQNPLLRSSDLSKQSLVTINHKQGMLHTLVRNQA